MVLREVLNSAVQTDKPVLKPLVTTTDTKIIAIGLKKGVILKEHTAPSTAQLTVIKGKVNYITPNYEKLLECYDTHDIIFNEPHSLEAEEDSLCLLVLTK